MLDLEETKKAVLSAAREGRFISYKQVAEASGEDWIKVRRQMPQHLKDLISFGHSQGWPVLSAIVVNHDNLQTGRLEPDSLKGFVSAARELGYSIDDEEGFLRAEQDKVFAWAASHEEGPESAEDHHSSKVFFTYVWGVPGDPAWPLTFASKAARTHAKRVLSAGDVVFTVGTKSEPTPAESHGMVLGAYKVSGLEVNTQDYVDRDEIDEGVADAISRFPYALHPIEVQAFDPPSDLFSELVGPLTPNHHLQAQTKVVELDAITAEPLLRLRGRQVAVTEPRSLLGRGRIAQHVSKLAPKHEGDYTGSFGDHEVWYVYVLALKDARGKCLAYKVGYSNETSARLKAHNKPMATEVTGLEWHILVDQPTSSEDDARTVEQLLLQKFSAHRLPSNGEIVSGVKETALQAALATALRQN
ncbi:hypothetical protein Q669_23615 [Labrenzia sp. C1B10]|uniref:GIY-YIG nuclease family protein n=1 Tax=unclassified Labrenzia TaxID=2648686 RepID=UPI0003B83762|nr:MULTISPECIES: GIY-YIG nuclease family protein [unclassified Labrenzia]ERP98187.1 hypothetical protein Q669_23615 [Labrenzia sp. C1B10]ERS01979.1 hypothetical protein Q675_07730 [Labrenzia sp. C1B70]